jgi:cobalt/nickel transport system permease protein
VKRGLAIFALGLLVSLLVAVVFSRFASSQPDGLEYVAGEQGFIDAAEDHALSDLPLADYGGDDSRKLMLAGLVGTLATLGLGYGVFWLARSREHPTEQ